MNVISVLISEIKPYANNPKRHPSEQVAQIADSIEKFGFVQPCVIDGDGNLIIGHGRVYAASVLGLDVVPCVRLEDVSDEDLRILRLIDNQLNMNSGWDMDLLKVELDELDFDFEAWGFSALDSIDIDEFFMDKPESQEKPVKTCPHCGKEL